MSNRYAPIASSTPNVEQDIELNAAFDDSDDEDEAGESQPLHPTPPSPTTRRASIPGTYDFESSDFDYTQPPPGSPPPPSSAALPNEFGNSNGVVPTFDSASSAARPRAGWLARALPGQLAGRLGLGPRRPAGVVGAGINNDGVFANVTAKPQRARTAQSADGSIYMVPEETQGDIPPSYAEASRDAVPQYWETTVHAPFTSDSLGEMIVEGLPTGSFFSFLWNMLVSISFQFVGFLLTYLLHTSHAARLGSRAGLGITLIQYGFALKGKLLAQEQEMQQGGYDNWTDDPAPPKPIFETSAEASDWYNSHSNSTVSSEMQQAQMVADATTEWLSFFLMTIGWFVLLTSVLGFWRVKRYEASIVTSQALPAPATAVPSTPSSAATASFLRNFRVGRSLFPNGFSLAQDWGDSPGAMARAHDRARDSDEDHGEEGEPMLPPANLDPAQAEALRIMMEDRRLQRDLAAAGLI